MDAMRVENNSFSRFACHSVIYFKFNSIVMAKKKITIKALFTRDILTHNIAIKRYCDKKNIFEPLIYIDQGKL